MEAATSIGSHEVGEVLMSWQWDEAHHERMIILKMRSRASLTSPFPVSCETIEDNMDDAYVILVKGSPS